MAFKVGGKNKQTLETGLDSRVKSDCIFHGPSLFAASAVPSLPGLAFQEDATQL